MLRCAECGNEEFVRKNQKGKVFPWRDKEVEIKTDGLWLRECSNCGNIIMSAGEAKNIDEEIEKSLEIDNSSKKRKKMIAKDLLENVLNIIIAIMAAHFTGLSTLEFFMFLAVLTLLSIKTNMTVPFNDPFNDEQN